MTALTASGAAPPTDHTDWAPSWHEDLADGVPGIALLHTHYAATGQADWHIANRWLAAMGRRPLTDGDEASLFRGVPAVAYTLRISLAAGNPERDVLTRWLQQADAAVAAITQRRLSDATARLEFGTSPPPPQDWNLTDGLTGIAAGLLVRDTPDDKLLSGILTYLVRLTLDTQHLTQHCGGLSGHTTWGMQHGTAGVLALLALATDHAITVPRQHDAIDRLCALLEPHTTPTCIPTCTPTDSPADIRSAICSGARGEPAQVAFYPRPSWCDGTAGIARALHLAAIALGDTAGRRHAETVLVDCLDLRQTMQVTGLTLCHGMAGLHHILRSAAADAEPGSPLATSAQQVDQHLEPDSLLRISDLLDRDHGGGLLTGTAGIKLAALTPATPARLVHMETGGRDRASVISATSRGTQPVSARWDACLLTHRSTNIRETA